MCVLQEELLTTMSSMSSKLEKEMTGHLEAKAQVADLQYRLEEMTRLVCPSVV